MDTSSEENKPAFEYLGDATHNGRHAAATHVARADLAGNDKRQLTGTLLADDRLRAHKRETVCLTNRAQIGCIRPGSIAQRSHGQRRFAIKRLRF